MDSIKAPPETLRGRGISGRLRPRRFGVASDGAHLDCETHEGTRASGGLRFDARAVAVSFRVSDASGEVWTVNTGMGRSTVLRTDGEVEVPCREGNSVPRGSDVRIALGWAP